MSLEPRPPTRSADETSFKSDPTKLTTDAIGRDILALKELLTARLEAAETATNLRLNAAQQTRSDFEQGMKAEREFILSKVDNVAGVTSEKFEAVNTRFLERDTRTEQAAQESRISLDAALAAAKEAVGEQNKSNTEKINVAGLVTQKQIDSLVALMSTSNTNLADKIEDIKSQLAAISARIDRGEAGYNGRRENRTETRADSTHTWQIAAPLLAAAVAILIAIASIVYAAASSGP